MTPYSTKNLVYHILRDIEWLIGGIAAVIGAAIAPDVSKSPEFIRPVLFWLQSYSWLPPFILFMIAISVGLRRLIERFWKKERVIDYLDSVCDGVFGPDVEGRRVVTLYKARPKKSGWKRQLKGHILEPIARGGRDYKAMTETFFVPDNLDEVEKNHGVVGKAFHEGKIIRVEGLPNLKDDLEEHEFDDYAERTFIKPERVRSVLYLACALYGIPIYVGKRRWGALVFDSRDPKPLNGIPDSIFKMIGRNLGELLSL